MLDAPLYKRKIVVEEKETIVHSDDFDAPGKDLIVRLHVYELYSGCMYLTLDIHNDFESYLDALSRHLDL